MLWELTLRFKVLSPSASAAVLAAFVCIAYSLAWKRNLTSIVWVADLATAIAAIALLIATHDILPFLAVLLLMAFLSEVAACRNRWLSVRLIVAVSADLAAWALIYIYSYPDRNLAEYANLSAAALVAPAIALFLIYGISVALRTILLHREIMIFETAQAMIAFLLAAYAVLHFAPGLGASVLGTLCLALSVAGYATVFFFRGITGQRNVRVYSTWSLALFLLGSFLCFPPLWLASSLAVAAILITTRSVNSSHLALAFHGLVYLCAAAFASGLLQYAAHSVAGDFPAPPEVIAWIIAAAIVLCYAIGSQIEDLDWKPQLFHTLSAALAVGSAPPLFSSPPSSGSWRPSLPPAHPTSPLSGPSPPVGWLCRSHGLAPAGAAPNWSGSLTQPSRSSPPNSSSKTSVRATPSSSPRRSSSMP